MPIPHRRVYMERYGGGSIVVSDYNPAWPAGDLRAGVHEPTYRSRSPCADYRAYWEYGGPRLGCQADHRSSAKRPQPRRSAINLRRAASGAGLFLHAAVRGPVARRAFLPEGTFRAMDTPPPYFARRPSPVAAPPSVS